MRCYERIRMLREDRGLSQTQIALYLHINQKTYSDYELENIRIPVDVSLDYITGASDEKKSFPRS